MIHPPYDHQRITDEFARAHGRMHNWSDPGCVAFNTEFLTPAGWVPFWAYDPDLHPHVAQFLPDSREIEFVKPLAFIRRPAATMLEIKPARGTHQVLSHEHRVLSYRPDGSWTVDSAADFAAEHNRRGSRLTKKKFATTFSVRNSTALPFTDNELRVMVAVIADGHFAYKGARCTFRLRKRRKIERLRERLHAAGIKFDERTCGGQPDFQVFKFYAPAEEKTFTAAWWRASQRQLEVIADELPHWDSSQDKRPSKGTRFSTFARESADFAQYAFAAAKRTASLNTSHRWRHSEGRGHMTEHYVHAQAGPVDCGAGRRGTITEIDNPDGFKYCFEVPSSFLLLRHNGYIFATGNTGKTRAHLDAFNNRPGHKRALVLAPLSILETAWWADAVTFTPNLRLSIAYAKNREKAFAAESDIVVTNHDAVKWISGQQKRDRGFLSEFDEVIVDEATAFKNLAGRGGADRARALADLRHHFQYRRMLTGTPAANSILDMWAMAFICDDGVRLGDSFYAYRNSVTTPVQVGPSANMIQWKEKPGSIDVVTNLLKDITIRFRKDECVDIPPNHMFYVYTQLDNKTRRLYDKMVRESRLELESGAYVSAIHAGARAQKLRQICTGAVYDAGHCIQDLHSDRYRLVLDLVLERPWPCLVAFNWSHELTALRALAETNNIRYGILSGDTAIEDRVATIRAYQAGELRVIFAHPATASHGITLTAGRTTIWSSPTDNAERFLQFNARVDRNGQQYPTETIMVAARDTKEEDIYELLQGKVERISNLLQLMLDMRNAA